MELFIWSGLVNASGVSNGKFVYADHLNSKAAVTAYGKDITSNRGMRFINVMAGLYMSNFSSPAVATPKKQEDGTFVLAMPVPVDSVVPAINTARDYGLFVRRAIEGSYEHGQDVYAYGEIISYRDIVRQMSDSSSSALLFDPTRLIDRPPSSPASTSRMSKSARTNTLQGV